MSFLKKSDVKVHLSSRDRNGKSLYRPSSPARETGFSGDSSAHSDATLATKSSVRKVKALDTPPIATPALEQVVSKSART